MNQERLQQRASAAVRGCSIGSTRPLAGVVSAAARRKPTCTGSSALSTSTPSGIPSRWANSRSRRFSIISPPSAVSRRPRRTRRCRDFCFCIRRCSSGNSPGSMGCSGRAVHRACRRCSRGPWSSGGSPDSSAARKPVVRRLSPVRSTYSRHGHPAAPVPTPPKNVSDAGILSPTLANDACFGRPDLSGDPYNPCKGGCRFFPSVGLSGESARLGRHFFFRASLTFFTDARSEAILP